MAAPHGNRVLVLGAGAGQAGVLEAARERGCFVIAVDRDPRAPGFRHADRRAIVAVEDERAVVRLARAERVDGVVGAASDWAVAVAARAAASLGLPQPVTPATAALLANGLRLRERLEAAGLPQPRFRLADSPRPRLGLPCIVRAPDAEIAAVVHDPSEFCAAVAAARAASRMGLCLVEELLPGRDEVVRGFVADGRLPGGGPALALRAIAAVDVRSGPVSVTLRAGKVAHVSARVERARAGRLEHLTVAAALGDRAADSLRLAPDEGAAADAA